MANAALINKGSIQDFYGQPAAPANPPAGQARAYYNSTTDLFHIIDSTGADIIVSSSVTNFSDVGAGTNANALVIGTGGSLGVSGSGTINATSLGGTAAASYALLNSPSFTTPALGTPASGVLTNATGYVWNNLANATGNFLINNGTFNTEWDNSAPSTTPTHVIANVAPTLQAATVLSQVTINSPIAGQTTYTGTITGGGSNGYAGAVITTAGFTNGGNNAASQTVLSSTATTLVVTTVSQVNETHAGTATSSAIVNSPLLTLNTTSASAGSSFTDGFTFQVTPGALTSNGTTTLAIKHATAGGTGSQVAFGSTGQFTINGSGVISKLVGLTLAKNGVGGIVATSALTSQSAAIGATTIYAVGSTSAGLYRISYCASITTVDGTSCVLGGATGFQVKFTNASDSVVKTSNPTTVTSVSAVNATTTTVSGDLYANCLASTNLQYLFGYTAVGGQMRYDLEIYVEYLG